MCELSFHKLIPGGNPTIVLTQSPFPPDALAAFSARLMDPLHVYAEQAGALYAPGEVSWTGIPYDCAHLQMMGGEFCVNATRSAAMLLARMGESGGLRPLAGTGALGGSLTVSGAAEPVQVLVARTQDALANAVSLVEAAPLAATGFDTDMPFDACASSVLFCAARLSCTGSGAIECSFPEKGLCLVAMPGMQHLLVDTDVHPLPPLDSSAWRSASAQWRERVGLCDAPASGVIWYRREGAARRIWPAVAVAATGSEHMESACGSASLAMAVLARHESRIAPSRLAVIQPSGETLTVFLVRKSADIADQELAAAWVTGSVRLVAQGTAYVEE